MKSGQLACSQFGRDPNMLMAQYLDNGWRYGIGANEAPIRNGYLESNGHVTDDVT